MQLEANLERRMQAQTAGLETKSAKIRTLGRAGYTRRQIADFLGIRYQHVRNVLVDEERTNRGRAGKAAAPETDWPTDLETKSAMPQKDTVKVKIGPEGQIALPAHMRAALNVKEGDTVWLVLEDGEIHVADAHAITHRVRSMLGKASPGAIGSADDFIAERRHEAEREEREAERGWRSGAVE
jgi:AbrB family looped-hinge helix DNA binding protein